MNTELDIGGGVRVVVSGSGSDSHGPYITYSSFASPTGRLRTPWGATGPLLVTRANNSVTLTYYNPAEHDLYFRTQKTSDSGSIDVTLDGTSLGNFDLSDSTTLLESLLLQSNLPSGSHTVTVIASIVNPAIFVYFGAFEVLEHDVETGGEYLYQGPAGTLDDSANNFIGQWGTVGSYAYTTDTTASVFFYPQLTEGGQVHIRVQKTPNAAIVALYVNGSLRGSLDLYADPAAPLFEITLLDASTGDAPGLYTVELRHTGTKNAASTGYLFYFHSAVVVYARTDLEALSLAAGYLKKVAALRGDGAFVDAWDSTLINFDANSLYACMGLLAAYQALGGQAYLDAVKNFLVWFSSMQSPDGSWDIGYQVNPNSGPTYIPAVGPYAQQGISEIRWVDAVQCLPAFVLWWYWKLSSDNDTKNALLPISQKGIDGFIGQNYDPETGFFYSSWQNKTSPTIFLYHDAIRRYSSAGALLEIHNDSETGFYAYTGAWASYAPQGAINSDEHYTLSSGDYVQFSLALAAGDQLRWVTQTAWDVGIAEILVSTDGTHFMPATNVDGYTASLILQQEFPIYSAPSAGTYWFRIQHTDTINAAGNTAPGWQRLASRFTAGQTDVALGLTSLWLMTRQKKYAALASRLIRRFPEKFWDAADTRWLISLDGSAPGAPNNFWYPMTHGYTAFGQKQSRFFQPKSRFAVGLRALEEYQNSEGGFQPPGYLEAEYIFSAFYAIGENQLASATNPATLALAKSYIKSGQYLLSLGGEQVGGVAFSKRYQYLYTNIAGFACLALAGALNPVTEQLKFSESRMVMKQ